MVAQKEYKYTTTTECDRERFKTTKDNQKQSKYCQPLTKITHKKQAKQKLVIN